MKSFAGDDCKILIIQEIQHAKEEIETNLEILHILLKVPKLNITEYTQINL